MKETMENPLEIPPTAAELPPVQFELSTLPTNISNGTENYNKNDKKLSVDSLDSIENNVSKKNLDKEHNAKYDISAEMDVEISAGKEGEISAVKEKNSNGMSTENENNCKNEMSEEMDIDSIEQISKEEECAEKLVPQETKKNNQKNGIDTNAERLSKKVHNSEKKFSSSEVQISSDSEDNVIEVTDDPIAIEEHKPQLRRSSRVIKRKRYDMDNKDYDSPEDEIPANEVNRKSRPVVINQIRPGTIRKENTVVITRMDAKRKNCIKPPILRKIPKAPSKVIITAHNLCQSIQARGTTITPVSSKTVPQTASTSNCVTQPNILPYLTDDMFVVEAPSFIVPYVYEKPSVIPFRKFVDDLGKELEKEKTKEKKEEDKAEDMQTDKLKEETDKLHEDKSIVTEKDDTEAKADKTSGQDTNENAQDKIEENAKQEGKPKKKKSSRGWGQRKQQDDDDLSWNESTSDSDDDDDLTKTYIIKSNADDLKDIPGVTGESKTEEKLVDPLNVPLVDFFTDIGLQLVKGHVQNDLLKQQKRKLYIEKKRDIKAIEASIASLKKNIEVSTQNNAPYTFKMLKCEFCSYKTESALVMQHHLETPHMKNNIYNCNFCEFASKTAHDILYHVEVKHNIRGKLERAPSYHQCANCPFEDNGKGKLARHLTSCAKKFKPEFNLSPPVDYEQPAKIPKMARGSNQLLDTYQNMFSKGPNISSSIGRPVVTGSVNTSMYRPRGRSPMNIPAQITPISGMHAIRGQILVRGASNPIQFQRPSNFSKAFETNIPVAKPMLQRSTVTTKTQKQKHPTSLDQTQVQVPVQQSKHKSSTCILCEICDGYIKDKDELRGHMQWIHKMKIHPKMIHNRPPLNCQKCQCRFFTDQGLERHLLGSHGLVTSSIQDAANKGLDGGTCPVCGRVFRWKLLTHVTLTHKISLKPAHLSYKCTVCSATFGMYKQFESHVYSEHSVAHKASTEKDNKVKSLLKSFKLYNDVTVTPQPAKSVSTSVTKSQVSKTVTTNDEMEVETNGEKNGDNDINDSGDK